MEIKIFWTDFAKNELHKIFIFYRENASLKVARGLVLGITHEVLKLENEPNIGQKEGLLIEREQVYRYLIYRKYKLIYWFNIETNRIEIMDVFDTRQNPSKIKRMTR